MTKTTHSHPRALYYLFFAELWERFSFYGMRALLTLYMVNEVFAAVSNKDTLSIIIYASYGSLVYTTPVIGGRLADKFIGFRSAIILGGIFMAIGHFVMAVEHNVTFFLALGFLVVGNGFFKPNISTMLGSFYEKGDPRKDSGFMLFYMGINLGGFIAPLLCGYLGAVYGWNWGFGVAGVGMLIGLSVFILGIKNGVFEDKGLAPENSKKSHLSYIYIGALLFVPLCAYLISLTNTMPSLWDLTPTTLLFRFLGVIILGYLFYILYSVSTEERAKLTAVIFLTFFMTIFWGFFELQGATLTLFAERNVDLWLVNPSQTNALNSLFVIALSIPISYLWIFLHKRKLNPYTPYKYFFGLLFMTLCFFILSISKYAANAEGLVPFIYLWGPYLLLTVGELFMSPIGLSKITELSPVRFGGFIMGVWFLSSTYGFQIVNFVGTWLSIDSIPSGGIDPLLSLQSYTNGFESITYVCLGSAVIALIFAPFVKKWMREVH